MKKYKKPQRFWTGDEIKFLKENYDDLTWHELAKALNRTPTGVAAYAKKVLNLKKSCH